MRIIAALFLGLAAASACVAQGVTGDAPTIIPRAKPATFDRDHATGDSARRVIDQFAACVLGRRHKPVLEALALPSGSMEQTQALGDLGVKDCIASGELNFGAATFRGSLYTALARIYFGRKPASLGPAPVDYTKQAPAGNAALPVPEIAALLNFASCVVHKDPQNARDAVISTAGSPAENAAMVALQKVYGECLFSDQTLRFSKGELIGLLAETYFREGSAPATQTASQ